MIALLIAALYTNTAQVQSIAAAGATLWAATGGGVEEYTLPLGHRVRVYTTEDGFTSNDTRGVWYEGAALHVRTPDAECAQRGERFECSSRGMAAVGALSTEQFHGARVTQRLKVGAQTIVATAAGLWLDGKRITPKGQICGNHIAALAEFRGRLWAGAFDGGLCDFDGVSWRAAKTPFRMVNALYATDRALYVAAAEGLFRTADGRRFRREPRIRESGVNGLAASRAWLFVTTPVALYAFRDGSGVMKRFRKPAGSTALQGVAVSGSNVWLASEDVGVIRMRAERFDVFDMAAGLPSSWMVDVAPAKDGGVWAATLRDGAARLDRDGKLVERRAEKAWGLRLYADGREVLFGTQQGLHGTTVTLPDSHVHAILRSDGALYVGTEGGLFASAR